jgi:hypothetical protein
MTYKASSVRSSLTTESKKEDEESFKVKRGEGVFAPTSRRRSFGTTAEKNEVRVMGADCNWRCEAKASLAAE